MGTRVGTESATARPSRERDVGVRPRGRRIRLLMAGGTLAGFGSLALLTAPGPSSATAPETDRGQPATVAVEARQLSPELTQLPRHKLELTVKLTEGVSILELLTRAGTLTTDAREAAALVESAGKAPAAGSEATLFLGEKAGSGRRLEGLTIRPGLDRRLHVSRDEQGKLRLASQAIGIDATPQRFRGRVGDNLYWSLRAAGVPSEAAAQYLQAIATRVDPRAVRAGDRFDLVLDHRLAATGESETGPLLYAGLDRKGGRDVWLVRWTVGGDTGFYEPGQARQQADGLARPVAGSLSSPFGYRVHPILGFERFHRGADYRANWGSPVHAAADGVVVGSGWNGGYGRQVRLAHRDGLETSYSHLSGIAAQPGAVVRKGQVIGFVGSSGFSTGPHLHYELSRHGRLIDPQSTPHLTQRVIGPSDLAGLGARLRQLQSI